MKRLLDLPNDLHHRFGGYLYYTRFARCIFFVPPVGQGDADYRFKPPQVQQWIEYIRYDIFLLRLIKIYTVF